MTKRRAGRAPEGSGVPVGTEYHWYIVAHQNVCKVNANGKWSATPHTQRKRMISFLRQVIEDLEKEEEATPKPAPLPTPRRTRVVKLRRAS